MSFDERRGGPPRDVSRGKDGTPDEDEAPTTVVAQDLDAGIEAQDAPEPATETKETAKPAAKPRTTRSRVKKPKADDTAA
jgi:hypothetical protein